MSQIRLGDNPNCGATSSCVSPSLLICRICRLRSGIGIVIRLRKDMPKPDAGERRKQERPSSQSFKKLDPTLGLWQPDNDITVERKRPIAIAAGVVTVFVGFILVWATEVQSRDMGRFASERVVLFVLALILVLSGAAVSFLASKRSFLAPKRRARRALSAAYVRPPIHISQAG
jgi:hypothetical protein